MTERWLGCQLGEARFALPLEHVLQVASTEDLLPVEAAGWVGLLAVRGGRLPVADGGRVLGCRAAAGGGRVAVVLKGEPPVALSVDRVLGVMNGACQPLPPDAEVRRFVRAVVPLAEASAWVIDPIRLRAALARGVRPAEDGRRFQLGPVGAPPAPVRPRPSLFGGGRVLIFRAAPSPSLAVPFEQVLEVGPDRWGEPAAATRDPLTARLDWRGRQLPYVDLAPRLGQPSPLVGRTLYLAVPQLPPRAMALRVAEVDGAAQLPSVAAGSSSFGVPVEWCRGVARTGTHPLVVLDPAALVPA